MDIYIVWTADKLETKIKTAFMGESPAEVAVISQHLNHGNSLLRGWIENSIGKIVLINGTMGAAIVPDTALPQLATLQAQISSLWEDTMSFGVAPTIREANRAKDVAVQRGGARILWYTPDLDTPQAQTGNPADPLEGLKQSLHKAEEQSPNSQFMEVQPDQQQEQPQPEQPAEGGPDQIKNLVMSILQKIKSQKKTLDQLKVQAPDTYNALLGAVQAMIVMARAMTEGQAGGGGGEPAPQDMTATQQAGAQQDEQQAAVQEQQEMAMGMVQELQQGDVAPAEAVQTAQQNVQHDGEYYSRQM